MKRVTLVIVVSLIMSGCGPSTRITGSWKNTDVRAVSGYIETNLYNADTEQLLWSAQSKIITLKVFLAFASDFAKVVVSGLEKDGLFRC